MSYTFLCELLIIYEYDYAPYICYRGIYEDNWNFYIITSRVYISELCNYDYLVYKHNFASRTLVQTVLFASIGDIRRSVPVSISEYLLTRPNDVFP